VQFSSRGAHRVTPARAGRLRRRPAGIAAGGGLAEEVRDSYPINIGN